ncbi:MAG TPA: phage tail protein [Chloroflexota bacterium]|nr:phage tail protein [Chloroflexota bacterium]
MAIVEAPARLTDDDLTVEAGATVELLVQVGPLADAWADSFQDYAIGVRGLPESWYTLSATRLRVEAGQSGEVLLAIHPPREDRTASLGEYRFAVDLLPTGGTEAISLPARLLALAPGAATLQSRLLQYLPAMYRSDAFLARFLLVFQSIIDPIEQTIDNTHYYLDPGTAPASFLPWLASWVGMTLDSGLAEASQRELIRRGVELHRWKGTRRGLQEEMKIRTGGRALIVENFDGMRLGQDASLGLNTNLGMHCDQFVAVTLATNGGKETSQQEADALVQELKPAHVGHVARTVPAPGKSRGGDHG